jgi:hypothetical protein
MGRLRTEQMLNGTAYNSAAEQYSTQGACESGNTGSGLSLPVVGFEVENG